MYPALLTDREEIARVEAALNEAYLSGWEADARNTEAGRHTIENQVFRRYNQAIQYAVPWVDRVAPLAHKHVLEFGCGAGSSTAAFAHLAEHVYAYDIEPSLVQGARARAEVLGLRNVSCHTISPHRPLDELRQRHADGVDLVLLYAVLEHCTSTECLETLSTSWELLRPGGHLVVIETPNRFNYVDCHTSFMPFFHMLPSTIALRYFRRSPRAAIVRDLERALEVSEQEAAMALIRLGLGISYHEFQLALREEDLSRLLVADGYEPEMLDWIPITLEERLLQTFFLEHKFSVPIGFTRCVLNLIFRKPDGASTNGPLIRPESREKYLINYATPGDNISRRKAQLFQEFGELASPLLVVSAGAEGRLKATHQVGISPASNHVLLQSTGEDPIVLLPAFDAVAPGPLMMMVDIVVPDHTLLQVFYATPDAPDYAEERSVREPVNRGRNLVFLELPAGVMGRLRLDPGNVPGEYRLHHLEVRERQSRSYSSRPKAESTIGITPKRWWWRPCRT
jgi:protein-L-isoaspartate O-methyltransferase